MPSGQSQVIEQAKVSYSPPGKELIKQTKLMNDQKRNYIDVGLDAIFGDQTILKV